MNKKGKILWLSDSPLSVTGYATISRNVLNGLTDKGWEVVCLSHNYVGQDLPAGTTLKDGTQLKFELRGTGARQYCADLIEPYIKELQPNVFGVLLDTFMLYPWIINYNFSPAYSMFYFPSDGGGGMPLGCENILKKFNGPVCMSKFGTKQVKDYYGIDVHYIPHAVDVKNYYPLTPAEKEQCKAKYGLQGKFVIGTVARNQGRKMMDRTIKTIAAFSILAKQYPDMMLFIHSDIEDPASVSDMRQLIARYNVENRVVFSGMKYYRGTEYKDMNKIYGVMDLFLLTTSGEGFGVPIIEAMAAGVPPLVTDYTTTWELLVDNGRCGEPIPLSGETTDKFSDMMTANIHSKIIDDSLLDGTITGSWNVERGIMSIRGAVDKIEKLYKNRALLQEYSIAGREKVLKYYNWDDVINQWSDYLEGLIKN